MFYHSDRKVTRTCIYHPCQRFTYWSLSVSLGNPSTVSQSNYCFSTCTYHQMVFFLLTSKFHFQLQKIILCNLWESWVHISLWFFSLMNLITVFVTIQRSIIWVLTYVSHAPQNAWPLLNTQWSHTQWCWVKSSKENCSNPEWLHGNAWMSCKWFFNVNNIFQPTQTLPSSWILSCARRCC